MRNLVIKINLDKIEGNLEAQVNFILKGLANGILASRLLDGIRDDHVASLGDYHGKIVGKMEIINE